MRASRLFSIIVLLQGHERLSSRVLADRLNVSVRTIQRDMDTLSAAGIPVYAEQGRHGGWALLDDFRHRLTELNQSELQALFVAQPAHVLSDLGLQTAADDALLKLLATLPDLRRHDATFMQERLYIDSPGWHPGEETHTALPVLQAALWQDCKVRVTYERGDKSTVERVLNPLGLVAKGRTWYLVAGIDDDLRTYRVSRIQAITLHKDRTERPENFNLSEYWQSFTAQFVQNLPRYTATLRVHGNMLEPLTWWRYVRVLETHPEDPQAPDDWHIVQIDFETFQQACLFIPGFGNAIEIIEPEALKAAIREQVRELATQYLTGD